MVYTITNPDGSTFSWHKNVTQNEAQNRALRVRKTTRGEAMAKFQRLEERAGLDPSTDAETLATRQHYAYAWWLAKKAGDSDEDAESVAYELSDEYYASHALNAQKRDEREAESTSADEHQLAEVVSRAFANGFSESQIIETLEKEADFTREELASFKNEAGEFIFQSLQPKSDTKSKLAKLFSK